MALNKEDKKDVSNAYGKALANKVSKVTKDGSTKLSRNTARLRSEGKLHKQESSKNSNPFSLVTHIGGKKIPRHYRGNTNSEGGIPLGKKPK